MRVGFGDLEIDFLDHDQIAVLATGVGQKGRPLRSVLNVEPSLWDYEE